MNWLTRYRKAERAEHNDWDIACKYWWGDRSDDSLVTNERCVICNPQEVAS